MALVALGLGNEHLNRSHSTEVQPVDVEEVDKEDAGIQGLENPWIRTHYNSLVFVDAVGYIILQDVAQRIVQDAAHGIVQEAVLGIV